MAKFFLSAEAEADLDEIHARITFDNPEAANEVLDAAYQSFIKLARTPGLGRTRVFSQSELADLHSWHVGRFTQYLIFYRRLKGTTGVEIVRVIHGARDLSALLTE